MADSPATFRVLALLSRKGGSGKTTLAAHLAVAFGVAGRRVMLVDCDAQASATAWAGLREASTPTTMQSLPAALRADLDAARRSGITPAVVDSAPGVGPDITSIARAAELSRPGIMVVAAASSGGWQLPEGRVKRTATEDWE